MKTAVLPLLTAMLLVLPSHVTAQAPGANATGPVQSHAVDQSANATASPTIPAANSQTPAPFATRDPRYEIQPGDVLDLSFKFSPEFNQSVTVQPDGFISLSEVGDVRIQGQTAPQVTESVRRAYAGILHDPVVTVVLKEFSKPFFIAGGEVKSPGKYELRGGITLAEAVQQAGGFTEAAKHSEVWLYRRRPGDALDVKVFNLKKMLAQGQLKEDLHLQNGDMFFVPQNTFSKLKGVVIPRVTIGPSIRF